VTADVIVASEVLEHLHDEALGPTLRTIRSKLKPGGLLLAPCSLQEISSTANPPASNRSWILRVRCRLAG